MTSNQSIESEILQQFDIIKKLGSGAYGHVWKAFQHATDAQRTFREISILKKILHKNIIQLNQVYLGKNQRDIYLVFQYMQTDLYHGIYDNILQPIHKKYVIYQMLIAVQYMHQSGIIHRDLKPSNVLLDSTCTAKICDFGLARLLIENEKESNVMTQGVATRWYRAPQILLGSSTYAQKADIWSIGCIIGEMFIKNPLFPGSSTISQLQKILQFTGHLQRQDLLSIECQYAQKFIQQCGNFKQKSFKQFFGNADSLFIDLMYKVLKFNPCKRLPIKQILKHEFFTDFYNEQDLLFKIDKKVELQVNDNLKLNTEEYKKLIRNNTNCESTQFYYPRAESVMRNKSPINNTTSRVTNRFTQLSPASKSPQRFRQIKKIRQPSFTKLLGSQKIKKRSDSRQSSRIKQIQVKQKKNIQLFSELIKNKEPNRTNSKSRATLLSDKQNIHSNNITSINTVNNCLKKFENSSTTSRVSFQGLKKTVNLKFQR